MILKRGVAGGFGAAVLLSAALLSGGAAKADNYSPGDFLMLNLNQAVLSPKPLGPPARFEPVPIEAKAEPADKADSVAAAPAVKKALAPSKRQHVATVRKMTRQHRNPLDAYASDTRIQVWPCRSGGICNWHK